MPSRTLISFTALAVLAGGAAAGQIAAPTAPELIRARQASNDMALWTRNQMEAAIQGGAEAKTQAYPARALSRWARALPTLFPAGSGPGDTSEMTQALPPVWSNRAGFVKAAGDYAAAADRLMQLSEANDTAGFKSQLVALHQTCDACHAQFKGGMQGPPKP